MTFRLVAIAGSIVGGLLSTTAWVLSPVNGVSLPAVAQVNLPALEANPVDPASTDLFPDLLPSQRPGYFLQVNCSSYNGVTYNPSTGTDTSIAVLNCPETLTDTGGGGTSPADGARTLLQDSSSGVPVLPANAPSGVLAADPVVPPANPILLRCETPQPTIPQVNLPDTSSLLKRPCAVQLYF